MSAISAPGSFHIPDRRPTAPPTSRTKSIRLDFVLSLGLLYLAVAVLTYLLSGMAGHGMLERARKAGRDAEVRYRDASRREALVRQRLETIANPGAIEEWALEHGFASPERLAALTFSTTSTIRANTRSSSGAAESAVSSVSPEAVALLESSGVDEHGSTLR
ncbi:MAG: hypothetical protein KIS66_01095 [Fimbriimonadaceae bacterium]|nr:hypothetical protein [Fimbriimonadaceae bacterium]